MILLVWSSDSQSFRTQGNLQKMPALAFTLFLIMEKIIEQLICCKDLKKTTKHQDVSDTKIN